MNDSSRKLKKTRCEWPTSDPLLIEYHDNEWGVPIKDDRKIFEFLVLESAQAGLSWITVLRKREGYRNAFAGFDPEEVKIKSRFLVADFTDHNAGVYFEAGYAMGLGMPVIWLCREDQIKTAHFDTRQYNHILWKDENDLYEKLLRRIEATIS